MQNGERRSVYSPNAEQNSTSRPRYSYMSTFEAESAALEEPLLDFPDVYSLRYRSFVLGIFCLPAQTYMHAPISQLVIAILALSNVYAGTIGITRVRSAVVYLVVSEFPWYLYATIFLKIQVMLLDLRLLST